MKILLIATIILSTLNVFASEDLSAPVAEKTKCSLGRTASVKTTSASEDQSVQPSTIKN
jgi:hypothetical protein